MLLNLGARLVDELYPKQMEVDYGVKVQKTHNAFETHLKRQHNSCFVKTGTGQLVDRNKLKIYFTSANETCRYRHVLIRRDQIVRNTPTTSMPSMPH
jgi:hypothetical protein